MALTAHRAPEAAASWLRERVHGSLRTDSRKVRPGDGFLAWPGHAQDARRYVGDALEAGASACLVEEDGAHAFDLHDARVATLPGLKAGAGVVADAYFDAPSTRLSVVAVTGTNGKTSSTWWIAQALNHLGTRCGVIGTLGVGDPPRVLLGAAHEATMQSTGLTTPDPVRLQEALAHFVSHGYLACAMEASSVGIEEHRMNGVNVKVAVFTNFTQDHLDYHRTMDAYWSAKRKLFAWPGLEGAVVNVDDTAGAALAGELKRQSSCKLVTCSVQFHNDATVSPGATLVARDVQPLSEGLRFTVFEPASHATQVVQTTLMGDFNVSNVLSVVGALRLMGVSLQDAANACSHFSPLPGRMQKVGGINEPLVVVDYAHTQDALDKALGALRGIANQRGGRLVVIFGCGGDRDPSKRAPMGAVAVKRSDAVVVTSDNPRSEAPQDIINAVMQGVDARSVTHTQCIVDRREAIAKTVAQASPCDVVLLAGKGHEAYQEIDGVAHPFSDVLEARAALAARRPMGATASVAGGHA
jgi:UDP-N-acetylmuramyl-tripeptide synthetase